METRLAFYRRRACEEYLAHSNAIHPEQQASHLGMARHFDKLAKAEAEKPQPDAPEQDSLELAIEPAAECS
ncbi:hypothetical protein [Sphingomonas alba]|uniref:DUF4167 domain-containing protein n=1 Tax=Sphingomonas alba TaxID=2908208 RepID=A0ABT0RJ81_9SPHN|nr:hypothetical protein [Sphingomonas alba]MCL6682667.1 hypothetical protein [Sphingomonas alba]